jgi:bacteriorhodopsin
MSRIIVQYVLPLLLPTLVFVGWLLLTRKAGENREETMARLQGGPWYWLVVAGFVLMAAGLIYLGMNSGSPPESVYVPTIVEDGRVIPGHMK